MFASFAQQRDEDILNFGSEHKKDLEGFRGMLAAINLLTFLAGGGICFWLVRLGLAPLDVLTNSVSRINEKDFNLDITEKQLPGELKPIAIRLGLTLDQLKKHLPGRSRQLQIYLMNYEHRFLRCLQP